MSIKSKVTAHPYLSVFIALIILTVCLGGVKGFQIYSAIKNGNFGPPVETVSTIIAKGEEWNEEITSVGNIFASQGAVISPQEDGPVTFIRTGPSATVKKGEPLITLDTATEEAELKSAEALAENAKQNLNRLQSLRDKNAVSVSELDLARADAHSKAAQVDVIKAHIDRKQIKAPFDGKVGVPLVSVGQYVNVGQNLISLFNDSMLSVDFYLPQNRKSEVYNGKEVRVVSSYDETKVITAKIVFIDPNIDGVTRNFLVRAEFDNQTQLFSPGMFVKTVLTLDRKIKVVPVPASSLAFAPYGDSVYVIDRNPPEAAPGAPAAAPAKPGMPVPFTAKQQIVTIGLTRGGVVGILTGLADGQEIVSAGVFKLHQGSQVTVNNDFKAPLPATKDLPNT